MEYQEVDTEDIYFEDAMSSDTGEESDDSEAFNPSCLSLHDSEILIGDDGPTGEDFHLEMDYEDRCAGEYY